MFLSEMLYLDVHLTYLNVATHRVVPERPESIQKYRGQGLQW